jgi:hypothetical protein
VIENPDYFIQTNEPPFPGYRFSGPDISDDQSVQLRMKTGIGIKQMPPWFFKELITGRARFGIFITETTVQICRGMIPRN